MTSDGGFICLQTNGESMTQAAKRTMQSQAMERPKINIRMMLNKKKSRGSSENDQT